MGFRAAFPIEITLRSRGLDSANRLRGQEPLSSERPADLQRQTSRSPVGFLHARATMRGDKAKWKLATNRYPCEVSE